MSLSTNDRCPYTAAGHTSNSRSLLASPRGMFLLIVEAFVCTNLFVFQGAGQRELIAMYAGALGDNAVERYAMFLTSLELSVDVAERRLALTRARDHGLDMERVAVVTAERTIEHAFLVSTSREIPSLWLIVLLQVLPAARGPVPAITSPQEPASDKEQLLVRSIEWTTFMDSTYDTALEQSVVILRYFLSRCMFGFRRRHAELLSRQAVVAWRWQSRCSIFFPLNWPPYVTRKNDQSSICIIDSSSWFGKF